MLTLEQKELVKNLYLEGLNYRQISEKTNFKVNSVLRVIRKSKIARNNRERHLKYHFNEHIFDVIDTEEKAYWLGFLYADGYVYIGKSGKHIISLKLSSKDNNHLEKFKLFLNADYPIYHYISKCKIGYGKSYSCLSVNSIHACNLLIKLGCIQRKTYTLKFPDQSIFINPDLIRHFIRGYFDGDGSVFISNEKHWRNKKVHKVIHYRFCGTLDFLTEVKNIINLEGSLKYEKRSFNNYELAYKRKKKLLPFFEFLYKDATIFLERKRDIFINYIKEECSETIISQLDNIIKLNG